MKTDVALSETASKNIRRWLDDAYDEATKHEIRTLLQTDIEQAEEAFYTTMAFGTGGIRGVMGVGTTRMNIYTVRELTQGLINYMKRQGGRSQKIVIGYDTRHNSRMFAEQAARVASSNGVEAFLLDSCAPTPLISFAVRKLGCLAGIMITASHNPPEYNGYKVYWSDGAQVIAPHDKGISQAVEEVRQNGLSAVHYQETARFTSIGKEIIQAYLQEIKKLQLWSDDEGKSAIRVLYSSLHGTGGLLMKDAFTEWGITTVGFVASQMVMDGSFPTVKIPNPEMPQALALGIDEMMKQEYDLFLATDPDADRVGVVVRHHGKAHILTGNQIAALMLEWILKRLNEEGKMPPKAAMVKSLVTTPLLRRIAEYWNVACFDVLTGFKYIAEKMREWELDRAKGYSFVFGGEESLGFLYGTYARDKDGISSSCVIAEIAAHFKQRNKTLIDALYDIWKKYGVFVEHVKTVAFPESKEGRQMMVQAMERLRKTPPTKLGARTVVAAEDILTGKVSGDSSLALAHKLPHADVLVFHLEGGGIVCIRPSGTEPKVKIYGMLSEKQSGSKNVEHALTEEVGVLLSTIAKEMTSEVL